MAAIRRILLALVCLILGGCNEQIKLSDGVPVSGKILLANGSPLSGGTLVLRPENGLFGATSQIQPDGTFELDNGGSKDIAPGKYQVFVRFPESNAKLRAAVNQRYQQSTDDGDSDVTVEIKDSTSNLVVKLKQ